MVTTTARRTAERNDSDSAYAGEEEEESAEDDEINHYDARWKINDGDRSAMDDDDDDDVGLSQSELVDIFFKIKI